MAQISNMSHDIYRTNQILCDFTTTFFARNNERSGLMKMSIVTGQLFQHSFMRKQQFSELFVWQSFCVLAERW